MDKYVHLIYTIHMVIIDKKFKKDIGERLRNLRKSKNKTLLDIVNIMSKDYLINLNEKSLRRYELGESIPKIDNLICLADYYGVNLDYLIYGIETSDDNLLNWEQSFRRLNRLIYSLVLIPFKDNDPNSSYKKYYFISHDKEVSTYFDKFITFFAEENFEYIKNDIPVNITLKKLDNLISDSIKKDSTNIKISYERLDKYAKEYGSSADDVLFKQMKKNEEERARLRKNL